MTVLRTLLPLVLLLLATPLEAAWRAARPETGAPRLRLAEIGQEPSTSRWSLLAPGDTLVVRLVGEGSVRLRTRPVFEAAEGASYRFAAAFDDSVRRFRRRAAEGPALRAIPVGGGEARLLRLGEEDRLDLPLPPSTRRVRIWMREERSMLVRVLLSEGVGQPHREPRERRRAEDDGGVEAEMDLRLAAGGYDSNPYLAPKVEAGEDAFFWPVQATGRVRLEPSPQWRLSARYRFDGRFFEDPVLDERRHELLLRQRWEPQEELRFTFEQRGRAKNATFFGRGAGEEIETTVADTLALSLADRFDYADLRLRARGEWERGRTRWRLDLSYLYRDYDEDYETQPDIYALDYGRLAYGLGASLRLDARWTLTASAEQQWRGYDEKFSREADGTEVPTEATRYRDTKLDLGIELRPNPRWRATAGVGYDLRVDRYAGYWDYGRVSWNTTVRYVPRRGPWLRAGLRGASWDYERARLGYDPAGALRDKSLTVAEFEIGYEPRRSMETSLGVVWADRENNSTNFAYEQTTVVASLAFAF